MYENLQDWFTRNKPAEDLIFKTGLWEQVKFIRDTIPSLLARSYEEYVGIQKHLLVISTHTSKSVLLPVYDLNWNRFRFIMRYNFYDWKVSVKAPVEIKVDADFMGLFKYSKNISSVYCEGFKNDWVYPSYSENKQKFTCEIHTHYMLFTFFWILKYAVLNQKKEEK